LLFVPAFLEPVLNIEASACSLHRSKILQDMRDISADSGPASLLFMFQPEVAVAMRSAPSLARFEDCL